MDLVTVKNTGTKPFTLQHAVHGDKTIAPGKEAIVHRSHVLVAFGHPNVRDEGTRRHRTDEYKRLRVQWGFYAGIHDEDDWDEIGPHFEVWSVDDEPQRIWTIVDDPNGTKGQTVSFESSENATVEAQLADMQAQVAQLTRLLSERDPAATPSTPVDSDFDSAAAGLSQAERNEQRDEIPKPPVNEPEPAADAPRTSRTGQRSGRKKTDD